MKYLMRMKNERGFSLVELMVSVGIIGVMSSVAVPKYQKFRANAAQSEAQANLSSIYTLQQLYFTENDFYAADGELDFDTANQRYDYEVTRYKSNGTATVASSVTGAAEREAVKFKATADADQPLASCSPSGAIDKWCINQDKVLLNDSTLDAPCVALDSKAGGCP